MWYYRVMCAVAAWKGVISTIASAADDDTGPCFIARFLKLELDYGHTTGTIISSNIGHVVKIRQLSENVDGLQ